MITDYTNSKSDIAHAKCSAKQGITLYKEHPLPVKMPKRGRRVVSNKQRSPFKIHMITCITWQTFIIPLVLILLYPFSPFSLKNSTTPCSLGHEAMTQRETNHDRFRIPNVVLIPFALVQSQVFWVCSVIWTLCMQWSTEEHQAPTTTTTTSCAITKHDVNTNKIALPQDPRVEHLRRLGRQRRPRGNSEPPTPTTTTSMSELIDGDGCSDGGIGGRARCTTISFPPSRKQRLLQTRRQLEGIEIRPSREDEKAGATCPPQWWQKTRFYIDALKHQQQQPAAAAASSSTSTLPTLPSSTTSTPSSPDASPIIVAASPPAMSEDIQQQQQQQHQLPSSLASQQQQNQPSSSSSTLPSTLPQSKPPAHGDEKKTRRRATILGLLHHQHRSSSKEDVNTRDTKTNKKPQRRTRSFFWKKKSIVNASS